MKLAAGKHSRAALLSESSQGAAEFTLLRDSGRGTSLLACVCAPKRDQYERLEIVYQCREYQNISITPVFGGTVADIYIYIYVYVYACLL